MSSELSYSSIKMSHHLRDCEDRKNREKKRQVLYLILHFLKDEGYFEAAKTFTAEAQLTNQFEVCDNVDLPSIIQEYESYYHLRFQKYPKICKTVTALSNEKVIPQGNGTKRENRKHTSNQTMSTSSNYESKQNESKSTITKSSSVSSQNNNTPKVLKGMHSLQDLDLTVLPITNSNNKNEGKKLDITNSYGFERMLKPLGAYVGCTSEWVEYAEIISKEICMTNLNTRWSDIMGLDEAKRLLKEAVVYPIKYPELFSGILAPWKGLLLYGPSGTGKTLLAKAVATECQTTFFNISASSIVSKWRGDSEKLVRVMFELARYHAPSTIFLDELDALASHRDGSIEHEGSRRLKSELLIQLDGLSQTDDKVFLLATSNLPWDLDVAVLRRLEKRILVDLPNLEAREAMFMHYLPPLITRQPTLRCDLDYSLLARATCGYSGSDIKLVCKEAAMAAMRQVFSVLESLKSDSKIPCLELQTITNNDLKQALEKTKPSAAHLVAKYQKWQKDFGST